MTFMQYGWVELSMNKDVWRYGKEPKAEAMEKCRVLQGELPRET